MPSGLDVALARLSAAAYSDAPSGLPAGYTTVSAEALGLALGPGESYQNGVYRNANAAALVAVGPLNGSPTLVLAFRGSDDREDSVNDLRDINADYPDFARLIAAFDAYAARAGFGQVAITGHSLGGAMTQLYMASHPDTATTRHVADTFGSLGALIADGPDARITNYKIADDPAVFLGENRKDVGSELRLNPIYAGIALFEGPNAFPGLTTTDVLLSLPTLTRDYENRGQDYVLPRANGTTFLLQDVEDVADADPAEHRIETYITRLVTAAGGSTGDDQATGGPGNDRLAGTNGDDVLDGGAGRDYVDLTTVSVRGDTVTAGGAEIVHLHDGQTDLYRNAEEIRFLDGRLAFDASDPAQQVVRLYQAALGRGPDQGGLNFWTDRLQAGASLSGLGAGFSASPEFAARFGGTDAAGYVDRLYQNVLGRPGDSGGTAYWLGRLQAGAARQDVLVGFAESAENRTATQTLVQNGVWDRNEAAQVVARLYDTALDRLPDAGGVGYGRTHLESGASSPLSVAPAFTAAPEFTARYGTPSSAEFVQALYRNTLDRPGDAGGVTYWTGQLDAGALTRPGAVLSFSESPPRSRPVRWASRRARTGGGRDGTAPGQRRALSIRKERKPSCARSPTAAKPCRR